MHCENKDIMDIIYFMLPSKMVLKVESMSSQSQPMVDYANGMLEQSESTK